MKSISMARKNRNLSQRRLAEMSHVSFRCAQIIESENGNPCIETLDKIGTALGYSPGAIKHVNDYMFGLSADSIFWISCEIYRNGEGSWKKWLFEFVDAFRRTPSHKLIEDAPISSVSHKIKALMACTVESLCAESQTTTPWWCVGIRGLPEPWFVAESENLKVSALVESTAYFRKRNIFVPDNFLKRV